VGPFAICLIESQNPISSPRKSTRLSISHNPLTHPPTPETPPGYDTWSWGKGAKTVRVDSAHSTAEAQKAAKQRHFISVIDEGVYQRGVFKRLGKRKKVSGLVGWLVGWLLT
jgi:hypothetical protein